MKQYFGKFLDCYHRTLKASIVLLFFIAVIVTFFQVLNRIIFKLPISWIEEVARYLLIWVTFLSAVVATRKGGMAAIDILTMRFSGTLKFVVEIFQVLVCIAFIAIVTVNLLKVLALQVETGQVTPALQISMSIPYLAIAIWGVLSVFEFLLLLIQIVLNRMELAQNKPEA